MDMINGYSCTSKRLKDPFTVNFGPGQIDTITYPEKLGNCYDIDIEELFRNGLNATLTFEGLGTHFEWVIYMQSIICG